MRDHHSSRILHHIAAGSGTTILDVAGLTVEFLTGLQGAPGDFCDMRETIPPGAVVPIHSHDSTETFLVLSGSAPLSPFPTYPPTSSPGCSRPVPTPVPAAGRSSSNGSVQSTPLPAQSTPLPAGTASCSAPSPLKRRRTAGESWSAHSKDLLQMPSPRGCRCQSHLRPGQNGLYRSGAYHLKPDGASSL